MRAKKHISFTVSLLIMSKLVRLSDEVYNWLQSKKRSRDTFEDVIYDMMEFVFPDDDIQDYQE